MMLSALQENNVGVLHGEDAEFRCVSTDTRTIKRGDLFVALVGERFDAHDMLGAAIEAGASGLVVQNTVNTKVPQVIVEDTTKALGEIGALFRQSFSGKVIAVTGSCGKTTVKGMLREVLNVAGSCIATEGNYNNHIGVPLTLARLDAAADYAVVEAGTNHPGEIPYLASLITADVALVTNVMSAHIGNFSGLDGIAEEKTSIYRGSEKTDVVINLDDSRLRQYMNGFSGRKIIGFTEKASVDAEEQCADIIRLVSESRDKFGRYTISIASNTDVIVIELTVVGRHNVSNALAAAAVAVSLGVSLTTVKRGLEAYIGEPGRMEVLDGFNGATVISDCYNANPGAMKIAMEYLSGFDYPILVCGDMGELGDQAAEIHAELGVFAKSIGLVNVLSVGEVSKYLSKAAGGRHFPSKEALVNALKDELRHQHVVLVKGSRYTKMEEVVNQIIGESC